MINGLIGCNMTDLAASQESSLLRVLSTVAVNSSYHASDALSKWFNRHVHLHADGFERIPFEEAGDCAGPNDSLIVAIYLPLEGDMDGDILLAFSEEVAMLFVDILLGREHHASNELGELEKSCLTETANIVSSSLANSLSSSLELKILPGAPTLLQDVAGAIIEPLVISQAAFRDDALVSSTSFEFDGTPMQFKLLLLPSHADMEKMQSHIQ